MLNARHWDLVYVISKSKWADTHQRQCEYESQDKGKRTYRFIDETPGASSTTSRQSSAHHEAEEIRSATVAPVELSVDRINAIEARLDHLQALVRPLTHSHYATTGLDNTAQATDIIQQQPSVEVEAVDITDEVGKLSLQGSGRVRFVSPIHWASLCRESAELDDIIHAALDSATAGVQPQVSDADSTATTEDARSTSRSQTRSLPGTTFSNSEARSTPPHRLVPDTVSSLAAEIRDELSSRPLCDQLIDAYFYNCHPLTPLVHAATFRRRYEQYWTLRDAALSSRQANIYRFQALLLALLYAGAASMPLTGSNTEHDHDHLALRLHSLALRMVRLAHFPQRPTLDTLRAYLLCHGMPLKEEEPLASVAFIGLALRAATILGLQHDPLHFPAMNTIEAEERRRTWLHLVHIDVALAIAAGLPSLINHSSDVRPISELKDSLIGTPQGEEYTTMVESRQRAPDQADDPCGSSTASMTSTSGILAAAKHKFTLTQRRFLQRLETGITSDSFNQMKERWEELGTFLTSARDRIPVSDPDKDTHSSFENNPYLNQWARDVIAIFLDQRFYLFCYPLLQSSAHDMTAELYDQTVRSCLCFLIRCAELSSRPEYQRFCWSWPGNHQPIHALIIVINDIQRNPASDYAAIAHNIVDVIFALSAKDGGLVGGINDNSAPMYRPLLYGGTELWKYILRLKATTWRAADWDTDLLWTRQEAVEVLNMELIPLLSRLDSANTSSGVSRAHGQSTQAVHVPDSLAYPAPNVGWSDLDFDEFFGMDPDDPAPVVDFDMGFNG